MPVVQSNAPVIARAVIDGLLSALDARPAGPLLDTALVKLFTAGPTPITPETVAADFTTANYDGYADVPWVGGAPVLNTPSGDGRAVTTDALFAVSAGATPQDVLGYYIEQTAGFVMGEYFETPIPMVNPGDFISLQVFLGLSFITQIGQ